MKSAPIITAVAAVLALGMTVTTFMTPQSQAMAHEADRAFRAGDARALARLVSVREWPEGDREAMIKEVLAVAHATSLYRCRPVGATTVRKAVTDEWHALSWWQTETGEQFAVRMRVAETPMGPRLVSLMRELIVHPSRQRSRTEGATGMALHAERVREAGERLAAWNLPGTLDTVASDDGETRTAFTPWSRYVETARRVATPAMVAAAAAPVSQIEPQTTAWTPLVAEPPQEERQ